jgi:hypothetical protein
MGVDETVEGTDGDGGKEEQTNNGPMALLSEL